MVAHLLFYVSSPIHLVWLMKLKWNDINTKNSLNSTATCDSCGCRTELDCIAPLPSVQHQQFSVACFVYFFFGSSSHFTVHQLVLVSERKEEKKWKTKCHFWFKIRYFYASIQIGITHRIPLMSFTSLRYVVVQRFYLVVVACILKVKHAHELSFVDNLRWDSNFFISNHQVIEWLFKLRSDLNNIYDVH